MLIDRPINVLTYHLYKNTLIPHKNIRVMRYGIYVLYSEFVKLAILTIFFSLIGMLNEFLFALVILLLIRPYSGGIHFNSFMGCFLFTIGFFILNVAILPSLNYINNPSIYIVLFPINLLIIFLCSPMPSKHRPIKNKKIKNKYKFLATFFTVAIYSALLLTNIDPTFKAIGLWTINLQAIQLLIGGGVTREKIQKTKLFSILNS
ncbi:accessory gene regulator ArgB-like protein [Vallitalea maricola]